MKLTGKEYNGFNEIETDDGITFIYGEVKVEEIDGEGYLKYDYEVTSEKQPENIEAFEIMIGDYLLEALVAQLETNEVVYAGGTDPETDVNYKEEAE